MYQLNIHSNTIIVSRKKPFQLLVCLTQPGSWDAEQDHAHGDLFWDDGESIGWVNLLN